MKREDFNFYSVGKSLPYSDEGFLAEATQRTMQLIAEKKKRNMRVALRWGVSVAASLVITFGLLLFAPKNVNSYELTFEETLAAMTDEELSELIYFADNDLMFYDEI